MTIRIMPDFPHTPLKAHLWRLSCSAETLGAGLAVPLLAFGPATLAWQMAIVVVALVAAASCDRVVPVPRSAAG